LLETIASPGTSGAFFCCQFFVCHSRRQLLANAAILFRASFAAGERDILTSGVRPLSLRGRLSGLGVWAIWTTLVVCALAPRPQTAAVPEATIVPPAQAAPVRNYVHPEELRSDVVWPDPQVALRWQLAPTARDLPPAESPLQRRPPECACAAREKRHSGRRARRAGPHSQRLFVGRKIVAQARGQGWAGRQATATAAAQMNPARFKQLMRAGRALLA